MQASSTQQQITGLLQNAMQTVRLSNTNSNFDIEVFEDTEEEEITLTWDGNGIDVIHEDITSEEHKTSKIISTTKFEVITNMIQDINYDITTVEYATAFTNWMNSFDNSSKLDILSIVPNNSSAGGSVRITYRLQH